MKTWEGFLGVERRLSFAELLKPTFTELRNEFIEWVGELGRPYGDLFDWWLTPLSGRNVLQTPIFLHLCYAVILKRIASSLTGECVVVCDDWHLLSTMRRLLMASGLTVRRSRFWVLRCLVDGVSEMLKFSGRWIKHLALQLNRHIAAKGTLREERSGENNVKCALINTFVDDACFGTDGSFRDRYLPGLSDYLRSQGYAVLTLPVIYNSRQPIRWVYGWLRKSRESFLLLDSYAKLRDYPRCAWLILRGGMILRGTKHFRGLDVTPLVQRERLRNASSAAMLRFFLYYYALRRWLSSGNRCDVYIDAFENMATERPPIRACREAAPTAFLVGYQHGAAIHGEDLSYTLATGEWRRSLFPDRIVCVGKLTANILASNGFSADRLFPGPALRYVYLLNRPAPSGSPVIRSGNGRSLLVVLPLEIAALGETLGCIEAQASRIIAWRLTVRIRLHPMMDKSLLLRACRMSALPEGWQWGEMAMDAELNQAAVVVGSSTNAQFDAAAYGVPIICLGRELGFANNFLERWADQFPSCRTVPPAEFHARLEEILADENDARKRAAELAGELVASLGLKDPATLSRFLPPTEFVAGAGRSGSAPSQ